MFGTTAVITLCVFFFACAFLVYPHFINGAQAQSELESEISMPAEFIIPYGAPETGFGDSVELQKMDSAAALPLLAFILALLFSFGFFYTLRDYLSFGKVLK